MGDYIGKVAARHDPEAVAAIKRIRQQEMRARNWWCKNPGCTKSRAKRLRIAASKVGPLRNRGGKVFCRWCGARDPRKP